MQDETIVGLTQQQQQHDEAVARKEEKKRLRMEAHNKRMAEAQEAKAKRKAEKAKANEEREAKILENRKQKEELKRKRMEDQEERHQAKKAKKAANTERAALEKQEREIRIKKQAVLKVDGKVLAAQVEEKVPNCTVKVASVPIEMNISFDTEEDAAAFLARPEIQLTVSVKPNKPFRVESAIYMDLEAESLDNKLELARAALQEASVVFSDIYTLRRHVVVQFETAGEADNALILLNNSFGGIKLIGEAKKGRPPKRSRGEASKGEAIQA